MVFRGSIVAKEAEEPDADIDSRQNMAGRWLDRQSATVPMREKPLDAVNPKAGNLQYSERSADRSGSLGMLLAAC